MSVLGNHSIIPIDNTSKTQETPQELSNISTTASSENCSQEGSNANPMTKTTLGTSKANTTLGSKKNTTTLGSSKLVKTLDKNADNNKSCFDSEENNNNNNNNGTDVDNTNNMKNIDVSKNNTTLGGSKVVSNATTLGGSKLGSNATTLGGSKLGSNATTLGGSKLVSSATTLGGSKLVSGATTLGGSKIAADRLGEKPVTVLGSKTKVTTDDSLNVNAGSIPVDSNLVNLSASPELLKSNEERKAVGPTAESTRADSKQKSTNKKGVNKSSAIAAISAARLKAKQEEERLLKEQEEREREEERKAQLMLEEAKRLEEENLKKKQVKKQTAHANKTSQLRNERMAMLGINLDSSNTNYSFSKKKKSHKGKGSGASAEIVKPNENLEPENLKKVPVVADPVTSEESEKINPVSASTAYSFQPKPNREERKVKIKDCWEDSSEEEEIVLPSIKDAVAPKKAAAVAQKTKSAEKNNSSSKNDVSHERKFRSPICCVVGHIDSGKTKILDKIRRTNVQLGESGGITQQIGATFFPTEDIIKITQKVSEKVNIQIPGLLIMDTPGHASFSNLRSRGTSICDIAILVVDLSSGLQPMTIEALNMLKSRKTPFLVALNKIDRCYGWKSIPNNSFEDSYSKQQKNTVSEFEDKIAKVITQFANLGLNANLYTRIDSKDLAKNISIVPTSATTGEGIPDLLLVMINLVQRFMKTKLQSSDEVQCTVLEVKITEGLGMTLDAILINGKIQEGDKFVVCGFDGAIVSTVKALLIPPPMRDLRVKNQYIHQKELYASQGLKIAANGIDRAIAGSQLFLIKNEDNIESLKEIVMKPLDSLKMRMKSKTGVYVQASTLGSLEALLDFLSQECKVPVFDFGVGPIHLRDVKAASVMLERNEDYACILAFDVKISEEARSLATKYNIRIFEADVIYHLGDIFTQYLEELAQIKKEKSMSQVIFPCKLTIKPEYVFNKTNPIILGVDVDVGLLKLGTPIAVYFKAQKSYLNLGKITGIERDKKDLAESNCKTSVCVKISPGDQQHYSFGRHFDANDELISIISRTSLDALKENYKEFCDVPSNKSLLKELKMIFGIQ